MIENQRLIQLKPTDTCACIAMDVVKSEAFKNKGVLRNKLNHIVNILNKKNNSDLAVPFQIRKGDEIIGVVSNFTTGYKVYRQMRILAWKYNLKLYFGLGLGTLDTGSIIDINEINGSAVINAWRAIDDHLKNEEFMKNYVYQKHSQHVSFYCLGDKDIPYRSINALIYTIYNELNGVTDKQRKLIMEYDINPSQTLESLGGILGYKKNAKENANKLLSRAGYDKYIQMQKDLIDLLNKIQKKNLGKKYE